MKGPFIRIPEDAKIDKMHYLQKNPQKNLRIPRTIRPEMRLSTPANYCKTVSQYLLANEYEPVEYFRH